MGGRMNDAADAVSAVKVSKLVKRYGDMLALDYFDLDVHQGEIFGLLGPNGSGKTTAINCILALLTFDEGTVRVFGEPISPTSYALKRRIGIVPQNVAVFNELTVEENIDYFCSLYVSDKAKRRMLVDEALDFVGLRDYRTYRPAKLSGGLLRRLNIACGIAHKPDLIFFDEPTVAVDPQSRNAILEGIQRLNREGATVIYTSHYMEEVEQIARGRQGKGITEVHIVGGVHPDHGLEYYINMIRRVKAILPEAAVKAFTAIELSYMIRKAGLSVEEGLRRLKEAGMEAIPGGGAEIFDQEIRSRICPDKGSTDEWLEVHETAHRLGIPTNATILYGHVEELRHRIDHLRRLRELQDLTGGFNAFIPLKYRNFGNPMSEIGEVSVIEDLRMLAMSRIYLDNVPHIKAYWVMYGKATTELALAFGADDIDGTIDDTTKIYSMAGADDRRPSMSVEEMRRIVRAAGCRAVERDTLYNELPDR